MHAHFTLIEDSAILKLDEIVLITLGQCLQTNLPRFASPPMTNIIYYTLEFVYDINGLDDKFLVGGQLCTNKPLLRILERLRHVNMGL